MTLPLSFSGGLPKENLFPSLLHCWPEFLTRGQAGLSHTHISLSPSVVSSPFTETFACPARLELWTLFCFLIAVPHSLLICFSLLLNVLQSSSLLAARQASSEVPTAADLVSAIEQLVKSKLVSGGPRGSSTCVSPPCGSQGLASFCHVLLCPYLHSSCRIVSS